MKTTLKTVKETQEVSLKKGICLEFFSAYQELDLERMLGLCDKEGIVDFMPLGSNFKGKIFEVGHAVWAALMEAFPDLDNTVIEQEYNEARNEIICKVEIFGTQMKEFAGLPSKGKRFSSEHIFIFQFTNEDKIKGILIEWNHDSFVNQLS